MRAAEILVADRSARDAFEYLTGAGMPVRDVAAVMQRAWLNGHDKYGALIVSVPSMTSDGAESAMFTIGLDLPARRAKSGTGH
jgi:hypothetical protein